MKYVKIEGQKKVWQVENGVTRIVGAGGGSRRRIYSCNLCGRYIDSESAQYPRTRHAQDAIDNHIARHGASENYVVESNKFEYDLYHNPKKFRSKARQSGYSIQLWTRLKMPIFSDLIFIQHKTREKITKKESEKRKKIGILKSKIRAPTIPFVAPISESREFNSIAEAIEFLKNKEYSELALDLATGKRDDALVLFLTVKTENGAKNIGKMRNGRIMMQERGGKCWTMIES